MRRAWLVLSGFVSSSRSLSTKISSISFSTSSSGVVENNTAAMADRINNKWRQLSQAWSKDILGNNSNDPRGLAALQRTMPLLEDPTSVPFVCRYRCDVIHPLTNKEVHDLADRLQAFQSLKSLRERILKSFPRNVDPQIRQRVETSTSKSELEFLYSPFKPPSKGSLEDRIRQEHPNLIPIVDQFWEDCTRVSEHKLKPRDAAVILLANKIASHTPTTDALLDNVYRFASIRTTKANYNSNSDNKDCSKGKGNKDNRDNHKKFATYLDFSSSFNYIRDHQILAIRRGVNQEAIKLSYEIDAERTESRIRRCLIDSGIQKRLCPIFAEAIHDAWSRLLRKRITSRLWRDAGKRAEERSIRVFCDNLQKALLAPPLKQPCPLLALDPGFQAGIKCALLDKHGNLLFDEDISLITIKFLGEQRENGIQNLVGMLQILYSAQEEASNNNSRSITKANGKPKKQFVTVALGNGHGSQECRELIREASDRCGVPINVQLVNEAGASVWSVTEGASREFPSQQAAAIAAVSIGRRFQNPLPELVKIPPRSLGLGMYQHDLSKKDLDDKLHLTSVRAVAEVGVDGNACSLEILEKIPGLTQKMSERIIKARPLKARDDLLQVTGLGPKTFENCAAFIRIESGNEPLDSTLVHPESYTLARYLLKKLRWDLKKKNALRQSEIPSSTEARKEKWASIIEEASTQYGVANDRILSVIDHLIVSMTNPDPRLGGGISIVGSSPEISTAGVTYKAGSIDGCSLLPSHLSTSIPALKKACPLRGIIGTVRNVLDFGAFIDVQLENDALLHRSKLGPVPLSSLLVGQEIGVDILSASESGRVSLALTGLNLSPDADLSENRKSVHGQGKRSYSTKATGKKPAAKRSKTSIVDLTGS